MGRRFYAATARTRLERRPHRRDRVSLGGGTYRAVRRDRSRVVRLKVDVNVTGGTSSVVAAKQATLVTPIVFAAAGDPVGSGLVTSLARPGGNVTGLSTQHADAAGKRIELLHEVICPCSKNELSDTPVPAATS
jgi:ABC transporter substrate binding protein